MSKKSKIYHKRLPIVVITSYDHCMDVPGNLDEEKMQFNVVGVLFAETNYAWYLATWILGNNLLDDNNEGFLILKTPRSKIKIVGYLNKKNKIC